MPERDPRTVETTTVLLLISDGPSGGTAIVLRRPEAPSFVVMGDDTEEGFARLRRGAIAYGVQEMYKALPRDMIRGGHTLHVREDHRPARVDKAGSLLGPGPEKLWVPLDDDGEPFERMRLPIPSLERPAYLEFELVSGDGLLEYRLDGGARFGEGFICTYCGKLCERKEPHTAAHGVAGHIRAGIPAGQDQDEPHSRVPLPPDTGPIELGRESGAGAYL
ncbi:hypothetical protein [Leifsonia sp. NPDC080035]|uniref:C2H2-type domain-containing protein n=1 Tax=Leifsonia sp. NPDC080035 TaxID=3143936 RepID=A0AAU7GGR7_9MICO